MSAKLEKLCQNLKQVLGDRVGEPVLACGEVTVEVAVGDYLDVARQLRDHADFRFEQLIDLCGVDYSTYSGWTGRRYAVVVHLNSVALNQQLRMRTFAESEEFPVVPSVNEVWNSANWFEREAFDLYGVHFDGHADLRRILTDYGFVGHPFRKDFPVSGYVEMRYDPEQRRVIYEPVSIEPREVTPRIVREGGYGRG
ncbi:NADH-quinone oxidoreductase subunit C [Denitratisoma sp. DHT3]|uniref:NADH-quinone oxidoreductase subunit C n=1 Tax=Denitratisoma sp. DHT3 TaxID=1981880 RepID=UPI0011988ADD|nr:NADH-quinone oxidoreductase subunit C [Denitratisoma sp. DHT3]QDX80867.1 NADH-quinone oxidoreductase subunit C [Denitratisoma sp. DHT3]